MMSTGFAALTELQVAISFGGPSSMVTDLLHLALTDGSYRKHMEALGLKLDRARARTIDELEALGIGLFVKPRGGFYLWCELPERQDAAVLARKALKKGVVLAPGNVFSPTRSKNAFLRFNVSQMSAKAHTELLRDLITGA